MNCSSRSIAGRRSNNEDACAILAHETGALLLVVADGMGGHQAGEVASASTVEAVRAFFLNEPEISSPTDFLNYAVSIANITVYRKAESDPGLKGMGTTLVMGLVQGGMLYTANAGDSRLYVYRNQQITQITKDHAYVQELMDSGIITEEEAKVHPMRHLITRCVGNRISIEADLFTTSLSDGDIVLLCSDGLCGVLEPEAFVSVLSDGSTSVSQKAEQLITAAYESGSQDNITVCLYRHLTEASV